MIPPAGASNSFRLYSIMVNARDRAKWDAFPKKLTIIRKQDIIDMRKGIWDYSSKVEQSTHNGQVLSSNLGGPTNLIRVV
jgi:hypothetical protein